ncbi:MAG TPA: FmdB family zinc ribbon protein [Galbitalea sp.]|nr:FmdB family zinc ribbon protein [Galbitalea sp.]
MPTYSYKCTECGTAFDQYQAFTDDALTVCPNCGGKLRKVFGSVGVSFNGSGFYRNDSRAGGKSGESSTSSASSAAGSSGSTSSESKSPDSSPSTSSGDSGSTSKSTPKTSAASPSKAAG